MKILFVFNHPAPYKVALLNGIAKVHDLHVIFERTAAKDRNRLFYNESDYLFKTHKIGGFSFGNENHVSFGVVKHLKKNDYDLIIINGYSKMTEMLALRYLKRKRIPYVFYINGGIVKKESRLKKNVKSFFIKGANAYLSPAINADDYLIYYGASKDTIYHYPYSTVYEHEIITKRITLEDKKLFWSELGISGENFTICVTSFIKRKNNLTLLKNWKQIDDNNVLILVGDGKEKELYLNYINNQLIKNVFLMPFANKETIFNYLKHADNAVYLSNFDIYGHVINEALSQGLNVLTSPNMIAAQHLIKHGLNGLLLPLKDCTHQKIIELFTKDFFKNAIKTAHENTIEKSIEAHLKIIEALK